MKIEKYLDLMPIEWKLHYNSITLAFSELINLGVLHEIDYKDKKILDFGGSGGQLALLFLEKGAREVKVIDLRIPEKLFTDKLSTLREFTYYCGDVEDYLKINSIERFDLIILNRVSEHIMNMTSVLSVLYSLLDDNGILLIAHDNYYHPSGHHDNQFLTSNNRGIYEYLGPKCWENDEKCGYSEEFRKKIASFTWKKEEDSISKSNSCKDCIFFRRTHPYAHLIYQKEFKDTFMANMFTSSLNKITPFQLKQYIIECNFSILVEKRTFINNEVPDFLLKEPYYMNKNDMKTLNLFIRSCKKNNYQKQINNYEEQINNYEEQINNYEEQINNYEEQINNYEEQINNYEEQINKIAWFIPVRKWRDNFRNKFL